MKEKLKKIQDTLNCLFWYKLEKVGKKFGDISQKMATFVHIFLKRVNFAKKKKKIKNQS